MDLNALLYTEFEPTTEHFIFTRHRSAGVVACFRAVTPRIPEARVLIQTPIVISVVTKDCHRVLTALSRGDTLAAARALPVPVHAT